MTGRLNSTFKLVSARRLLDGRSRSVIENGAVLIEGAKIVQVGRAAELRAPDGADLEVFSYPEGTLLPGLIDAHTHFNYRGDGTHTDDVMKLGDDVLLMRSILGARTHLASGVTTVRENGAKNRTAFSLKEGRDLGLIEAPRMLVCGRPITITGGHMWQHGAEADGPDGVRRTVRQLVKEGADWIKVPATGGSTRTSHPYRPSFTLEELRAIVDEAHRFGKLVAAHCLATAGIVYSLDAGADMIIHGWMKEVDGSWKFRPDVAERIAREGRTVNPTLHGGRARLQAVRKLAEKGEPATVQYLTKRSDLAGLELEIESEMESARRLLEAGVPMIAGSDAGFGFYPFGEYWRELVCLEQVGMSAAECLVAATGDAAQAIGVAQDVGTLEAGKMADLLVVKGNPAEDLAELGQVLAVFQGGSQLSS